MKKITKLLTLAIAVMMLSVSFILPSYAADLSKDGVYTVPVSLYHASKEKLSKGDSYIIPTAIITVENGKKYIIVVADGVDDLTFSYYLDGSLSGDTAEATKISGIVIDGTTYSTGYKFPLVTDNSDVGVKFKAPVMPVSPSARLRIDYSGLKAISVTEETTTKAAAKTEAKADATTAEAGESETAEGNEAAESNTAAEETTTAVSGETEAAQESAEEVTEQAAAETTAPAIVTGEIVTGEETTTEKSSSPVPYIVIAAAAVAIAIIVAIIIKKKKS